jgi:hypothetical protein
MNNSFDNFNLKLVLDLYTAQKITDYFEYNSQFNLACIISVQAKYV